MTELEEAELAARSIGATADGRKAQCAPTMSRAFLFS
jgi:hypothetical protein